MTRRFIIGLTTLFLAVPAPALARTDTKGNHVTNPSPQTGYLQVDGLNMYYEIHGDGKPLVTLHGAYHSIVSLGELVPRLAKTRQVIGVEL